MQDLATPSYGTRPPPAAHSRLASKQPSCCITNMSNSCEALHIHDMRNHRQGCSTAEDIWTLSTLCLICFWFHAGTLWWPRSACTPPQRHTSTSTPASHWRRLWSMALSAPTRLQLSMQQAQDWPLWDHTQTSCSLCGTGRQDALCCATRLSHRRCTMSPSRLTQMGPWSHQVSCCW